MDTWFTHDPLSKSCVKEGVDVIGMVKQMKQKYTYQGKKYTLKELRTTLSKCRNGNIIGSVQVTTTSDIQVNLVYLKNRNKKQDWKLDALCVLRLSIIKIIFSFSAYSSSTRYLISSAQSIAV